MTVEIEIYEFSRAFDNIHYSDNYNQWVSGGYGQGKFNRLNKNVPAEIEKLVTTNYFSLNDSYPPRNGEVALVGCDLDNYSLLMVANGQIDDGGRPTIGYRYFWLDKQTTESEIDGVGTLLFWWKSQLDKPQFDMEKARFQDIPEVKLTNEVITREKFKVEFADAIARIISEPLIPYIKVVNTNNFGLQNYPDYIQCHYIAYYFALEYNCHLAWAWNVRRLIAPRHFLSIYAATEKDFPNIERRKIENLGRDNQPTNITNNQGTSQIEECLKDIESRFTSQKDLQRTGKLNELLAYLAESEDLHINRNRRLYENSPIYRALLALILPDETAIRLNDYLSADNLQDSRYRLALSLHQQLFVAAKQHNQKAYEYLYNLVNVHIADLLIELISVKNKQYLANIKYLLSEVWNLPFHQYIENLEVSLFSFLETQELNKEYDKFQNYVLNILQEIQTQFRNQEQLYDQGNKFTEIVQLLKQNGFSDLASILLFLDNKKIGKKTPDLLINYLTHPDSKKRVKTKSHFGNGLLSFLITQPIQMMAYIILLPVINLFERNRHRGYISDMDFLRRLGFYVSAGIFSALLGWSISQIIWIDLVSFLGWLFNIIGIGSTKFELPPLLILTVVTPCMAIAMVIIEIFLSNPTRYKANWRVLWPSYLRAVTITGLMSGTLLSLLNWQLLQSNWSSIHVRLLSWGLIGCFVGLAESVSWSLRSIEGSGRKARIRILQSTILGIFAGLLAAIIYSNIRQNFGQYQEPVGFALLGILLGAGLSFASRPSYLVALRAGHGFESLSTSSDLFAQINNKRFPQKVFGFVPVPEGKNDNQIEEGLSIKLPPTASAKKPIIIGSNHDADIFISSIPEKCLSLWFATSGVTIKCEHEKAVEIQQKKLSQEETATLRHNQILTLYHQTNSEEFYRFIFYDRFLDPQA